MSLSEQFIAPGPSDGLLLQMATAGECRRNQFNIKMMEQNCQLFQLNIILICRIECDLQ